jgi:hypothetical protein
MTDHCPAQAVELPGCRPMGLTADCRGASRNAGERRQQACAVGVVSLTTGEHDGLDHGSVAD